MATHKITNGETLSSIANQYGTTVNELASLNGISNPNMIYAGTELKLPGTETAAPSATTTTTPAKTTKDYLLETEGARPTYKPSDALLNAENTLKEYENNKPGEYQSQYSEQTHHGLG